MSVELTVVDAFTNRPFSGNPAGVCILDRPAPEPWMQAVASEMHLPETAFASPRADGSYDLRWFTPVTEVDLCGHATLATAHLLGGGRFHTRSGLLACRPATSGGASGGASGDGGASGGGASPEGASLMEMDFPAGTPVGCAAPAGLMPALGLGDDGASATSPVAVMTDGTDLVVVIGAAAQVRGLRPDLAAVAAVDARAVVVTAPGDRPGIDCVSRVFGPRVGIPEDPVTGSAHCTLAPWWAARLGRSRLVGEQASRRGGVVHMRLEGNRVILGGQAVTVSTVRLLVDPF